MATYKPGRYTNVKPGKKVPAKPGAERYVSKKTGKVVYQGETSNLRSRMSKQKSDKMPYTKKSYYQAQYKVADGRSTSKTRREHEKKKVREKDPPFNRRAGGGGRKAKGGSGRRSSR